MGNTCRCCTGKTDGKTTRENSVDGDPTTARKFKSGKKQIVDGSVNSEHPLQNKAQNFLPDGIKDRQQHEKTDKDSQVVVETNHNADTFEYMDVYDMGTQMTANIQCCDTEVNVSDYDNSTTASIASSDVLENNVIDNSKLSENHELQVKFITKGLQIPVYVQSAGEDHQKQVRLFLYDFVLNRLIIVY